MLPTLQDDGVTLRPLHDADLDRLVSVVTSPGVREWWGSVKDPDRTRRDLDNGVFATRSGRPWSQRNVARELRRAQQAARRPNGTPTYPELHQPDAPPRGVVPSLHSFRHTAASRFLLAGDTADEVAALLGHKDATVTRVVYLHEIEDADRRALRRERINSEFGAALDA